MSEELIFPVADDVAAKAWVDNDKYLEMYQASVDDPEAFWGEHGKRIDWIKPYTKVKDVDFTGDVRIKWYEDGTEPRAKAWSLLALSIWQRWMNFKAFL